MPHSFAITPTLPCNACGHDFDAQFWYIVDTVERPDLTARIREGALNNVNCSHCGNAVHMDGPLLLYRPGGDPVILFSPAEKTNAEQQGARALWAIPPGPLQCLCAPERAAGWRF